MTFGFYRGCTGLVFIVLTLHNTTRPAFAAAYTILDLGTLGGNYSEANGINASGQVVGLSEPTPNSVFHAYIASTAKSISPSNDIGTLGGQFSKAFGINAAGQVVGQATTIGDATGHAFRTTANGVITVAADLGTLSTDSHAVSIAYGINASGQAIGKSDIGIGSGFHAFRTSAMGKITADADLGTLGGKISEAYGINASGQTVGNASVIGNVASHAYRTTATGKINDASDLGTLGGSDSTALGINDLGQVVGGAAILGDAVRHAFRTTPNGTITLAADLGNLGGTYAAGFSINAIGQTVGESWLADNTLHAFFVDKTGPMLDLNSLIDSNSGWVLNQANGINDSGQIVGNGTINGLPHAYVLTPTPEPASLSLAVLGGVALFRRGSRRKS